ncbi:uncharacterized protein PG998_008897 [Apiospora kogelbergensis]|uniref:uncharacterized protein n=1 Tax=Apiospora kogelbergensis TaxID=1337665 RepID=UPI00312E9B25
MASFRTSQFFNMMQNGVVSYGTFSGLGTPDALIPGGKAGRTYMEGLKSLKLFQIFYMANSTFIKASICSTLLRVSFQRRYNYILYGIMGLTSVNALITIVGVVVQCKPLAASWGEVPGACRDQRMLITFTYVVSFFHIATDWLVATIPVAILWNLQMRRTVKLALVVILGLGVFSSVATIIRIKYSAALPMLRSLFRCLGKELRAQPVRLSNIVTIGQLGKRGARPAHDTLLKDEEEEIR